MPQQTTDYFRRSFNTKIQELFEKKGQGSCFLSKDRYIWIINRLNELSSDETLKKNSRDYRLQRRYEVYETNINGGEQKRMLKIMSKIYPPHHTLWLNL